MGLTVVVNYMTVSHGGSNGLSIAFPDVCKTPILGVPVPIPYPNIAMSSDVSKGSKKVKCDGEKVLLKSSEIKRSMGDEAGVQMGIVSNKQMGKGKFANYSFDVKFEGKNVCRLADPTTQNRGTMNTAAFCHIQKPDMVSETNAELIKEACKEVKKKNNKEKKGESPAAGPETSGIIERHWDAMRGYLDKAPTKWLIYFRKTGEDCAQWIEKNHEPKPHEWTDGLSLKEARKKDLEPAIQQWLSSHPKSKTFEKAARDGFVTKKRPYEFKLGGLYGVIISQRAGEVGRPVIGIKNWRQVVKQGNWMTGDYDMMDIVKAYAQCQRPTGEEFGLLRFELNNAMNWPGIQHPHQTAWNTANDPGFKGTKGNFSNLAAVEKWMVDVGTVKAEGTAEEATAKAQDVPKGNIAPGRDLKLIDDKLTILGPKGGLYLENNEDFWQALACCGCLDMAWPDEKGDSRKTKRQKAKARKPYEYSHEPEDLERKKKK